MISRRNLMRSGVGLAALSLLPTLSISAQLTQVVSSPSPRMKWEDFAQDPVRLESLKRGVATMKSRLPSDPTSWFFQAAIHAVGANAITTAAQVDPAVATVDQARFWNQCPHSDAYNSAEFLLWHRAYIYYFERILRDAAQDPTLSLPYWNYTDPDPERRMFPAEFADMDPDPGTLLPRNPLFDHRRETAFMVGAYVLSEGAVGISDLFAITDFFGATEAEGFAGGVADNDASTRGRIESLPHDILHFAIGGQILTGPFSPTAPTGAIGLMSTPRTAAFDPIFWVHHSNIDRLWTVWECLTSPARVWGKVPPRDWLEAKPWFFHDFDRTVHNESRLFYLDRRNLAISFDSDMPDCTPLSASDPFAAASEIASGDPSAAVPDNIRSFVPRAEAGRLARQTRVSPAIARTISIPLTLIPSLENADAREAILSASRNAPRRLMLELRGLTVEGIPSVGFDVYVNLKPGVKADRTTPNYVGTLALFGAIQADAHTSDHANGEMSQQFDITRLSRSADFDPSQLTVKIVPFDLLTPREGQPRLRRSVGVSFSEVRVLVVEGSTEP